MTDKDPSLIQHNDATYSDRDGDYPHPAVTTAAIQNQMARSKTVSFAIVKEFSFGC